jgi:hypothetical protein
MGMLELRMTTPDNERTDSTKYATPATNPATVTSNAEMNARCA